MALARCSNSMPMPSLSTVDSCRYHAKPSTPTCVMLPPKQPYRSSSVVRTPARAAERRGEPTRPAADDEHVGLVDYVDLACGFRDSEHASASVALRQ